jgi:hypothetical protein
MRRPVTLGALGIAGLVALLATDRVAFAQAGSTGGTIGKTGKSVSGGEGPSDPRYDEPRIRQSHRSSVSFGSAALSAASLRGRWHVDTTCVNGSDDLTFDIREISTSEFNGDYDRTGKIVSGRIDGNHVTLTTRAMFTVTWTGTVTRTSGSGLLMKGRYSPGAPPGNCEFTARKG